MPRNVDQLQSLASSLEDLTDRLRQIVNDVDDDDEMLVDLSEVERQLMTASRRLSKSLRGRSRRNP